MRLHLRIPVGVEEARVIGRKNMRHTVAIPENLCAFRGCLRQQRRPRLGHDEADGDDRYETHGERHARRHAVPQAAHGHSRGGDSSKTREAPPQTSKHVAPPLARDQGRIDETSSGSSRQVTCGPAATQSDPWAARMAPPPSPVKRWTARLVRGSMRMIGAPAALIHTEPNPATISPSATLPPRAIVATTLLVAGS